MMGFQDSMNDLKSVSFDLLYSQVSSLVTSYNELKASGEINDAFEKRLLILQRTISSMRNLIQNMEDFNGLSGNVALSDNSLNKEDDLADFISNSKEGKEEPVNDSGLVFTAPLISNTPISSTPITDSEEIDSSSVTVTDTKDNDVEDKDDVVNASTSDSGSLIFNTPIKDENVPISPINASVAETPVTAEEVPVTVEETPVDQMPVTVEDSASVDVPVAPVDVNVRAIASFEKFKRISDSPVKAIIVNDSQFDKLTKSLNVQAEQLDFGASSSENNMSIEAMIEKANDLYNRGDRQAAEEIYNKINSMSLVKKAA